MSITTATIPKPPVPKTDDVYDPLVTILGWFAALPPAVHKELFDDFEKAVKSRDLRTLLDAIADWAATAELYANPALAAEVREAIAGREEVLDWLNQR